MQLTHDYRRVRANWGSDGDFITPEGRVVHVGENHTIFMMDHPEMFGGSKHPDEMVGQGWVQTRMIGWIFSVKADGGMNQDQLQRLQEMVRDRCRYSDPQIQVLMPDESLYNLTCDDFIDIKYPGQIKRRGLSSARAVPFITKEDLRFTREGDPWVDPDWLESGLKRLLTVDGEHFSFAGKIKKGRDGRALFRYESGQDVVWISKDHKIYKEENPRG